MFTQKDLIMEAIKSRQPLQDPAIDLAKVLDQNNTKIFIKACTERIFDEGLFDDETIKIDLSEPYNLHIKAEGIKKSMDILKCYIPQEQLEEFIMDLNTYSSIRQDASQLAAILSNTSRYILKALVKGYHSQNITRDLSSEISEYARAELEQRRLSKVIGRKANKIKAKISALWKYKRLILYVILHPELRQK